MHGKEGINMAQSRNRIVDVADALGLSTATVSKVFVMSSLNAEYVAGFFFDC